MGNTIRREPVSFGMPAAPDYKFLNITNFGGIHQSENPFLTENNTASDCLNVYVDETNALTTRPRLEKKTDYFKNIEGFNKILYTYPLFEKQVFQVSFESGVKFYVRKDGVFHEITGATFTEDKSAVLEQDNKIYIMNNDYYVVKSDYVARLVSEDDETYIPTTQLGSIIGVDKITLNDYEEENLLTSKIYKKFTWDGTSPINQALQGGSIKSNGFVKTINYEDRHTVDFHNWWYGCGNGVFMEKQQKSYSGDDIEKAGWVRYVKISDSGVVEKGDKIPLTNYLEEDITDTLIPSTDGSYMIYQNGTQLKILALPSLAVRKSINYASELSDMKVDRENILYNEDSDVLFILGYSNSDNKSYKLVKYDSDGGKEILYSNPSDESGVSKSNDIRFVFNRDFTTCIIYSDSASAILISGFDATISTEVITLTPGKKYLLSDGRSYIHYTKTNQNSEISLYSYDASIEEYKKNTLSTQRTNTYEQSSLIAIDEISSGVYVTELQHTGGNNPNLCTAYIYYCPLDDNKAGFYIGEIDFPNSWKNDIIASGRVFAYVGYYGTYPNAGLVIMGLFLSQEPLLVIEHLVARENTELFSGVINFRNKKWFYGKNNIIRWTAENDPTYLPPSNYDEVGLKDNIILDVLPISDYALVLIKHEGKFVLSYGTFGDYVTELITESKSAIGGVSAFGSVVANYNELPLYLGSAGIYCLRQKENISPADFESLLLSERITKKLEKENDKERAHTASIMYWSLFAFPKESTTDVFLLDGRTNNWFYWSVPVSINRFWKENDKLCCCSYDGEIYSFETSDILTEMGTEYYDDGQLIIPWFWRSQILHLGTMNYSKKLNTTTFIMIDSDSTDEYGLNYKFKIFRKLASESNATTISNRLNYIQSITKKTIIPRFNFLQFEVSNIEDDYDNNKLRLVGLGLKYELLAGLM